MWKHLPPTQIYISRFFTFLNSFTNQLKLSVQNRNGKQKKNSQWNHVNMKPKSGKNRHNIRFRLDFIWHNIVHKNGYVCKAQCITKLVQTKNYLLNLLPSEIITLGDDTTNYGKTADGRQWFQREVKNIIIPTIVYRYKQNALLTPTPLSHRYIKRPESTAIWKWTYCCL